ncbi:ArsR/SmtB family transcription factor [Nonomuraea ferruginea]
MPGSAATGGAGRWPGRPAGWSSSRPASMAAVLAAAGHPARLRILQLLVRGPRPAAELQTELSPASQGQLYHHLKTLSSAGLVEQPERGVYRVPPSAIFPVLAMIAAATDVVHPR